VRHAVGAERKGRTMSGLENGMLVQHVSLGLGKIIALEPKAVHVFFAASDGRFATKLRLPMALPLLTPAASPNAWLSALSDFALDAKTDRYGLAATWLSHADAIARFLDIFPKGFADPKYLGDGRTKHDRVFRWRCAHDAYVEAFGGGKGERMLAAGNVAELVECALGVERHVRTLLTKAGKGSFASALKDLSSAHEYFAALFHLLAVPAPEQSRFEALAAVVAAMVPALSPESGWPMVTLLPFIARPDLDMVLQPRFACDGAHRLALELAYEPKPCWSTYSALLRSVTLLLHKLEPLGAHDYVDVDSFMHVVTTPLRPKVHLRLVT
jgi:hypothetical protein